MESLCAYSSVRPSRPPELRAPLSNTAIIEAASIASRPHPCQIEASRVDNDIPKAVFETRLALGGFYRMVRP